MTCPPNGPGPEAPGDTANLPPQGGGKAPRSAATPANPPKRYPTRAPRPEPTPASPPRNAFERRQRARLDKQKAQARAAYARRMELKAIHAERQRQHMQDAADHERELDGPQE